MQITPQDLGPKLEQLVLRYRLDSLEGLVGKAIKYLRGYNRRTDTSSDIVTVRSAACRYALRKFPVPMLLVALAAFIVGLGINVLNNDALGYAFNVYCADIGGAFGGVVAFRCYRRQRTAILQAPLSHWDLGFLLTASSDPLKAAYCQALIGLISIPSPRDLQTKEKIRQAVFMLGTAVSSLPDPLLAGNELDPAQVRAESAILDAKADAETDEVVALSLERRARTLAQRADVIERTKVLSRRNAFIRDEIAGQIGALQTNISAAQTAGNLDDVDLTDLAASIAQVSEETASLARARDEVDHLLHRRPTAVPQGFDMPNRLG